MVDESKAAQSEPATGPVGAGRQTQEESPVAGVDASTAPTDPGFLERGGLRRRLRFLRKTRELAYRDLGGLVFEMHRLGQQREDLLASKMATLGRIDSELRSIEETLRQRRGVTVLREAGVTACPRCAAIHGSEDRFCPACGFSMGSYAERPIGAPAAAASSPAAASAPAASSPAAASAPAASSPAAASAPAAPTPATALSASRGVPTPRAAPPTPAPAPRPPSTPPTPVAPVQQPKPVQATTQQAARNEDQPTQVIEPPTQIVHPSSGESPAEKSGQA
jgi:hypothetical protein